MFKAILVPIRGDGGDKASLGTALAVATLFGSHIDVVHIQSTLPLVVPAAGPTSAQMISGLQYVSALRECDRNRRHRARRQYKQFCANAKIPQMTGPHNKKTVSASWADREGDETDQIIRMADRHDLIVLRAVPGGEGGFSPEEAGEIILCCGGPVMLAPSRPSPNIARKIAIAWKNTPEAAGALTAAMPLLYRADQIFVIGVCDDEQSRDPSVDNVVARLHWHGLNAVAEHVACNQSSPATPLMDHVGSLGADLLVMGAYGRNRMREYIFGSFTKQVLSGASLPVFLSH
jgi:nucleotide-binding universal stress UspA family protein